jgi:hypothetical protein
MVYIETEHQDHLLDDEAGMDDSKVSHIKLQS